MTYTENACCQCDDVTLSIYKEEVAKIKPWSNYPLWHLIKCATLGVRYLETKIVWNGRCSKCGELYLISDTKKGLLESINASKLMIE